MREKRERQVIVKRFTYGKAPHFVTKHGALLKYGVNRPLNRGLALQGSLLPSFGCRLTQAKPTDSPLGYMPRFRKAWNHWVFHVQGGYVNLKRCRF